GAKTLVDTLRIEVFSAQVRKALERRGWRVLDAFPRTHRRDLIAQGRNKKDATQHHLIPVFALASDSWLLDRPGKRLRNESCAKARGEEFLVVPPLAKKTPRQSDGVQVVTIDQLLASVGSGPK